MESFEELKAVCHAACHQRNACKDGFAAMLMAENTADLMHVWRRWWQDIYVSKYADIMTAKIATATGRLRREMRQSDVFVNEPTERGLLIVCKPERPITVGGRDISKVDPETLMSLYSIVFQDVTLFNNTVLENIRIGRPSATDAEVEEAEARQYRDLRPGGVRRDFRHVKPRK